MTYPLPPRTKRDAGDFVPRIDVWLACAALRQLKVTWDGLHFGFGMCLLASCAPATQPTSLRRSVRASTYAPILASLSPLRFPRALWIGSTCKLARLPCALWAHACVQARKLAWHVQYDMHGVFVPRVYDVCLTPPPCDNPLKVQMG